MQEFIRGYFSNNSIFNYLHNACMASTRSSLNENNLDFLNIALPNDQLLTNYEKISKDIINKILLNKDENKRLRALLDFLLPLLMNGQINVDDIDI